LSGRQPAQLLPQQLGGRDDERLESSLQISAVRDRAAPSDAQRPQCLDPAVALLGRAGADAGERGPCRGLGVDRVGLALPAAGLAVGTVHLDQRHLLVLQVAGQAVAVDARALDADAPALRRCATTSAAPRSGGLSRELR